MGIASATPRTRRLALIAAVLLGLLLPELVLRGLLFTELFPERWSAAARDPARYADDRHDPLYWSMHRRFVSDKPAVHRTPDAELGWRKAVLAEGTYRHEGLDTLDGRRPILLVGSSFAACMGRERCYTELFDESELAPTHALLNCSAAGWGFDQIVLCVEKVLETTRGLDPIVVVAPVVETDFGRCLFNLRQFPKPRFRIVESGLALETPPTLDADELLALDGSPATSYAWRLLVHGSNLLPESWSARLSGAARARREIAALSDELLARLAASLSAHDVEGFVLLFHLRRSALRPAEASELRLHRALVASGLRWVDTQRELEHASGGTRPGVAQLYEDDGIRKHHPTDAGTAVFFGTLMRGLAGEFDGDPPPLDR